MLTVNVNWPLCQLLPKIIGQPGVLFAIKQLKYDSIIWYTLLLYTPVLSVLCSLNS